MLRPDRASQPDLQPDPPLRDLIRDLSERIEGLTARLDWFLAYPRGLAPPEYGRPGRHPDVGADHGSAPSPRSGSPEAARKESGKDQALAGPDRIQPDEGDTRGRSPYLDAKGAAAYLGITLGSLYGTVERGHITPLRGPRRRYRFTTAMLDEYLGRKGGGR
jgi:excisionase family DNA binding protein